MPLWEIVAFDPMTGVWSTLLPIPVALRFARASGTGRRLVVFGASDSAALRVAAAHRRRARARYPR